MACFMSLTKRRTPWLALTCSVNLSYGVFSSQLLRLARVNSILSGFKTSVIELIGKLIAQGFE